MQPTDSRDRAAARKRKELGETVIGSLVPARALLEKLLNSSEPSLRWKTRTQVLGDEPHSRRLRSLEGEVRRSRRVQAILQRKGRLGRTETIRGV